MSKTEWKSTAELIGIAAIVASLVFVGMELRQSQRIAFAEQEGSQITDFQAMSEIIASYSILIRKLNNQEPLTEEEQTEAEQLVFSIWATHFFTRQRARYLDHPSVGVQERVLAILFYENPGLRRVWAAKEMRDKAYMEALDRPRALGSIGEFNNSLDEHLNVLDKLN
jgi:hypothetical protein